MHTLKSGWGPTPYRESCPSAPFPFSLSPLPCSSRTNFFQQSSRRGMRVTDAWTYPPADLASST
jgi:hypothetical protein